MSLDRFGNVMPIQADVLMLIGYALGRGYSGLDIPEAQRLDNMREGLRSLRRETGQDFGYDLGAWHAHLTAHPEHGYAHPYAASEVHRAVEEALTDPDRVRLSRLLEADRAEPGTAPDRPPRPS